MIATIDAWPYGLRCMDCDKRLLGHGYSRRLVGITDAGDPITEIVCVPCAARLSDADGTGAA